MEVCSPPLRARLERLYHTLTSTDRLDGDSPPGMSPSTLFAALLALGLPVTERDAISLVSRFDSEGRGCLTFSEFAEVLKTPDACLVTTPAALPAPPSSVPDAVTSLLKATLPGLDPVDVLAAFNLSDADGDHAINAEELAALVNELGAMSDPAAPQGLSATGLVSAAVGARPVNPTFTLLDAAAVLRDAGQPRGEEGPRGLSLQDMIAILACQRGAAAVKQ